MSRDNLGNAENRLLRKMDDFGKKDILTLPENQAGGDSGNFPSMGKENALPFSIVKEMMISIKNRSRQIGSGSFSSWA